MASQFLERAQNNAVNDTLAQANWSEKKLVWVADKKEGYLQASIVKENGEEVEILLGDNTKRIVNMNDIEKMNPPKFDLVEDMAELTHLNEASVVHNLKLRYLSNLIYTYSGLFCVTVNPYKKIPIYSDEIIRAYKGKKRCEMPPHVYCVVDQAYNDMVINRENQSILITGESGAGKTENTKKVIQYLTASSNTSGKLGQLETQIIQANPVLEAFGNAQTIRNNNSSRFGKFIRIEFGSSGQIAGANIERYLLEKSRVTHQNIRERNYHVFYQLLKGASSELKETLLLDGTASDYRFTKNSNKNIDGVDDVADFKLLQESLLIMTFSDLDQTELFRVISAILHLGNLTFESDRDENAIFTTQSSVVAEKICHILGIPIAEFSKSLLKPRIKAGRDWVQQARNVEQVYYSVEALARTLYERMFGKMLDKINRALYTPAQKSSFIGVLDIAGFEIFDKNSFEQLCINYTNERLQQFFNHHMFILEQEEYKREGIEWKFIDFGLDLQPAIDLIEKTTPVGILSLLDEECVMPKASDKTFIDKLNGLWKGKSPKYEIPRFNAGFILQHYAGKVEYSVSGWLDKNKDPLNENVTRLLSESSFKYIGELFSDSVCEEESSGGKAQGMMKKGAFRTVAQKHKESLSSLMNQLYSTQPHFVRCIIPNEEKKAGKIDINLVLDQLRCNGVLEGIRICRAGFPNRLLFQDFRSRYEVLAVGSIPKGYIDGRTAATILLDVFALDKNQFRIGSTKVFFRAGVLAHLENLRDVQLGKIVIRIQAIMRGHLARKIFKKRIDQSRSIKIIQRNARIYVVLREWSWWKLYSKVKPLLNASRSDEELKLQEALAREWEDKAKKESEDRNRVELLRISLDLENKRIEELLMQEKCAAVDQAEILARTQKREFDLNERLKDVINDLSERERQNELLNGSKMRLEGEVKVLQKKNESDSSNLDRLEKEKNIKDCRLVEIEVELTRQSERACKLEIDKKAIEFQLRENENLLKDSNDGQADLTKQKSKLQASIVELEIKHEQEASDKQKIDAKRQFLELELANARNEISELERVKFDFEFTIKKRESDIISLNDQLSTQGIEKDAVERQKRDLGVKLHTLQDDLGIERFEKEKLVNLKKKAEEEVEVLQNLMQEKGNEASKQGEIRRIRDQEVSNYKTRLAATETDLEDARKKAHISTEKLNIELELVRQDLSSNMKAKQALESQIIDLKESLEKSEDQKSRLEKNKKQTEIDLDSNRSRLGELDVQMFELKSLREHADKQLANLQFRFGESEIQNTSLEREKQSLQRNVDVLQEELDQEFQRRSSLEVNKKRLSVEVADLQAQVEEEILAKSAVSERLATKTSELDLFKDKYNRDVVARTVDLEESKKRVEKDLVDAISKLEEFDRNSANLERTKARFITEIEDLKLEIDREHNNVRNADRLLKQVEAQVTSANLNLENERCQREVAESNSRKLQSTIDSIQLTMDERSNQIVSLQKSKNDLEIELKALINEIGDGGKNVHELERTKRRLESQAEELNAQIEIEQISRANVEDAKKSLDLQFGEFRKKSEFDMLAKDSLMEETRRVLMKEVNGLGEQLDDATNQKNEATKSKKRLEEQIDELNSRAESSAKGQFDLQKVKNKNEALVRDLQVRLDEEQKNTENLQELCHRHEKKANTLQSEIERLEIQIDSAERSRKQLEKRIEELDKELNTGDDSKISLLEIKRRLSFENHNLQKQIDDYEEAKLLLESKLSVNNESTMRGAAYLEYEDKITKLEDSRRALMAAQRLAAQELEEKTLSLISSEKAKRQLQLDLDELKCLTEAEIVAKGEESAMRRKMAAEVRDLMLRLEAETNKSGELSDALLLFKARTDQTSEKLESAELGRIKVEKSESNLRIALKDAEDNLADANKTKISLENHNKALDDQILDLQDKLEEQTHELAILIVAKKKMQEEFGQLIESHRDDVDEREAVEELARKKYQKEIKTLVSELETEKSSYIIMKESVRDLEIEIESMNIKIDAELRSSLVWKKEKEKSEQKYEDLSLAQIEFGRKNEDQNNTIASLVVSNRDLKQGNEDKEVAISILEKAKKSLEQRLHALEQEYNNSTKEQASINKSVYDLDHKAIELKDLVEETQRDVRSAEERAKRSESHASDVQLELFKERSVNIELEKAKLVLEKSLKELNGRLFEIEGLQLSRDTNTTRRLESRLDELSGQLESEQKDKNEALKNSRKLERTIRELQFQLAEKEKYKSRFDDEQDKMDQKIKKMKFQLEELELSESNLQLAKRRAEREAVDYRERANKFEKECDKLKLRATSTASFTQ